MEQDNDLDAFTAEDVFDELRSVIDPEHPGVTLADLNVITKERCVVCPMPRPPGSWSKKPRRKVTVVLKPTVPHCHLMLLIALCVRTRLFDRLPLDTEWKVDIALVDGSHLDQKAIEKQVNDKERVRGASENKAMMDVVRTLTDPHKDEH